MNRRELLGRLFGGAVCATVAVPAYGQAEATDLHVVRSTIVVPRLPRGFQGLTVAFLTDLHHGPLVSLSYIRDVVRTALSLEADLILLGGDYVSKSVKFLQPCFDVLQALQAPLGVYGVLGNHDFHGGAGATISVMRAAGITPLRNQGVALFRNGDRLWLGGVDDLWLGQPSVKAALAGSQRDDCAIVISHNPDVAEGVDDYRVGLVLSGHTHGGQVILPGGSVPVVPSRYGNKYRAGLAFAPMTQVYTSVGIGLSGVPFRLNCPPAIDLLTLA